MDAALMSAKFSLLLAICSLKSAIKLINQVNFFDSKFNFLCYVEF